MKAWKKTSPELLVAFDKALPASPGVTRRPMFGYASAFVNGNMFAGTFQDAIVVRLAEDDRVALLKKGAAPFEPMGSPDEGVRRRSGFHRRLAEGAWCVDRAGVSVRARVTSEDHSETEHGDESCCRETDDRKADDRQKKLRRRPRRAAAKRTRRPTNKRGVGSYSTESPNVYIAVPTRRRRCGCRAVACSSSP